jgi:hypothetical protein
LLYDDVKNSKYDNDDDDDDNNNNNNKFSSYSRAATTAKWPVTKSAQEGRNNDSK